MDTIRPHRDSRNFAATTGRATETDAFRVGAENRVQAGVGESGANRGRLRGNGEPGWRAFDGVGEAGVPAAELVGEVGVGPQVAGEPANWGQDSRVGGEVPVHRRFTDADGGLPELASSPVPSVHQLRVVLRGSAR